MPAVPRSGAADPVVELVPLITTSTLSRPKDQRCDDVISCAVLAMPPWTIRTANTSRRLRRKYPRQIPSWETHRLPRWSRKLLDNTSPPAADHQQRAVGAARDLEDPVAEDLALPAEALETNDHEVALAGHADHLGHHVVPLSGDDA